MALLAQQTVAKVDFQREVRPILAENCFPCHGPDSAARKAELRLDTRERRAVEDGAPSSPASRTTALVNRRVTEAGQQSDAAAEDRTRR